MSDVCLATLYVRKPDSLRSLIENWLSAAVRRGWSLREFPRESHVGRTIPLTLRSGENLGAFEEKIAREGSGSVVLFHGEDVTEFFARPHPKDKSLVLLTMEFGYYASLDDEFLETFLALLQELCEVLDPVYGNGDVAYEFRFDDSGLPIPISIGAPDSLPPQLFWFNYFGPPTISLLRPESLLDLPAYKQLSSGRAGLFVVMWRHPFLDKTLDRIELLRLLRKHLLSPIPLHTIVLDNISDVAMRTNKAYRKVIRISLSGAGLRRLARYVDTKAGTLRPSLFRTFGLWMGETVVRHGKGRWVAKDKCSDFVDCRVETTNGLLDPFAAATQALETKSGDPIRTWILRTLK